MTGDASYPMAGREQPDRDVVARNPRLFIINNHLGTTLLGRLRDRTTSVSDFNETASELARLVLYEACRDLPIVPKTVEGFSGQPIEVYEPGERIAAVAILRAGLVFQPAFHIVLPGRPLYHLGIKRNEETLEPYVYARNVPERSGWADRVLILDPMLATGGSAAATVEIVRQSHQGELDVLCMVAAPSASRPSSKPTTGSAWSRWPSTITSTSKASSFLALATLATATSARSAWKVMGSNGATTLYRRGVINRAFEHRHAHAIGDIHRTSQKPGDLLQAMVSFARDASQPALAAR